MIIIFKSKVSLYSFKSACCLAVENIFLKERNASFLDRLKNGICREKAGNVSQIASSACLRSNRSIGHHYVNVLAKTKWQKVVKKISHLQTKIGDTNLRTLSR